MLKSNPFRYFKTSPEIIRLAVMLYVRSPISRRNVEDLMHKRVIDICQETVLYWWNRFGPLFAAGIRRKRVSRGEHSNWQWHLDGVFVRINGKNHYIWRTVDHEGEVLDVFISKKRNKAAALKFLEKAIKKYRIPSAIITNFCRQIVPPLVKSTAVINNKPAGI